MRSLESGLLTVYGVGSSIVHAPDESLAALWECERLGLLHPRVGFADDGRGFDHSQTHQQGRTFGLRSMEARAAAMGARFEVDSKPGHGTVVTVRVPMA